MIFLLIVLVLGVVIAGIGAAEFEKSIEKLNFVWGNIMLPRTAMIIHKIAELKTNISENINHKDKAKCRNKVLTTKNHKQKSENIVCVFFSPKASFSNTFCFQRQKHRYSLLHHHHEGTNLGRLGYGSDVPC